MDLKISNSKRDTEPWQSRILITSRARTHTQTHTHTPFAVRVSHILSKAVSVSYWKECNFET